MGRRNSLKQLCSNRHTIGFPSVEIERLIQKLEIDNEILADPDESPPDDDIVAANQRDRNGQVK
jgi:hypothetical protein